MLKQNKLDLTFACIAGSILGHYCGAVGVSLSTVNAEVLCDDEDLRNVHYLELTAIITKI